MLNSCSGCQCLLSATPCIWYSYLLDRHHNLHGVQAVKAKVIGEVGSGRELRIFISRGNASCEGGYRTLEGSET